MRPHSAHPGKVWRAARPQRKEARMEPRDIVPRIDPARVPDPAEEYTYTRSHRQYHEVGRSPLDYVTAEDAAALAVLGFVLTVVAQMAYWFMCEAGVM